MTNKQLNEVAETTTSSLQQMSETEVDTLVDLLYTQRLVQNGSTILASPAHRTPRTTLSLQERSSQQPEALATLLSVSVETSLRFFFAPLFFVSLFLSGERARETESGDGTGQERELASQKEYSLIG